MRCRWPALFALLAACLPARAQPPACPPPQQQPGIPLQLDLNSLPGGAARGVQGNAMVMVPSGPPPPCAPPPHLPEDVLHGDPGDALSGEPARR